MQGLFMFIVIFGCYNFIVFTTSLMLCFRCRFILFHLCYFQELAHGLLAVPREEAALLLVGHLGWQYMFFLYAYFVT